MFIIERCDWIPGIAHYWTGNSWSDDIHQAIRFFTRSAAGRYGLDDLPEFNWIVSEIQTNLDRI
jgi:hypothetical protein